MNEFKLKAPYKPTGDQPQAIEKLVEGFKEGNQFETLLGVTGSGKTFTMANVIAKLNKPTLVLAHNKTLAAQLYGEMKEFFPENAVEYFVSYYDYYQPEAYVPSTDTYIAKDASTNDEIDKLRLSARSMLLLPIISVYQFLRLQKNLSQCMCLRMGRRLPAGSSRSRRQNIPLRYRGTSP